MCNTMMDGPLEFTFEGDRVVIRGTSDGDRVAMTLRLEDALLTSFRFSEAYKSFAARQDAKVIEVSFARPALHADTA